MPVQTKNLVMVGLGFLDEAQVDPELPAVAAGVHLRWSFLREQGFPLHGYSLFRRRYEVARAPLLRLSEALAGRQAGSTGSNSLSLSIGGHVVSVQANGTLELVNQFALDQRNGTLTRGMPDGTAEIDLRQNSIFEIGLPGPAYQVDVGIGFLADTRVQVTGKQWGQPVARELADPARPMVTLRHDAITSLEITGTAAVLGEVRFRLVADASHQDWEPVPGFDAPLRLPVSHSAYSGTGSENLDASRGLAQSRLRYDPPGDLTAPPRQLASGGTVAVETGSLVVTGSGTAWERTLVGSVFCVDGNSAAYLVTDVPHGNRLVLSRPYESSTASGLRYMLNRDSFGVLHDQVIQLVRGGLLPSMASRTLPVMVHDAGAITTEYNSPRIAGTGTGWSEALEHLTLHVAVDGGGRVDHLEDAGDTTIVVGAGTGWRSGYRGALLRLGDEPAFYTIESVDVTNQTLLLDRRYVSSDPGLTATPTGGGYAIYEPTGYRVSRVDSATKLFLEKPYIGPAISGRGYIVTGQLAASAAGRFQPQMGTVYPLDLVLFGAVHPAIAQMLGLYWIDDTEEPRRDPHDYLLLGDYDGEFSSFRKEFEQDPTGLIQALPNWLSHHLGAKSSDGLDAYIVFEKQPQPQPRVPPPEDIVAYALPTEPLGGRGQAVRDTLHSIGLNWEPPADFDGTILRPDRPILFHAWRAPYPSVDTSDTAPESPPSDLSYEWISKDGALLRNARRSLPADTDRLPGWPDVPLDYIDVGVDEGWYSYLLRGIDIFGRFSPPGAPARWEDWDPRRTLHPSAVRILDQSPPPPPAGVEAVVLDPADPFVTRDAAYQSWRAANPDKIGLRISWLWTEMHARQAPDAERFRIHFASGRANALVGHVTDVAVLAGIRCRAVFQLSGRLRTNRSADAFAGTRLQASGHSLEVVGSDPAQAGSDSLRLRLQAGPAIHTIGTMETDGTPRTIGKDTAWRADLQGLLLTTADDGEVYAVREVLSATVLRLDRAAPSGTARDYAIHRIPRAPVRATIEIPGPRGDAAAHPIWTDYSEPAAWEADDWQPQPQPLVRIDEHVTPVLELRSSPGGPELLGDRADVNGRIAELFRDSAANHPPDLRGVQSGRDFVIFDGAGRRGIPIRSVDVVGASVTLAQSPSGGASGRGWRIGRPARRYEIFMEAPANGLTTDWASPIAAARIGVTTMDERGNESVMGGPADVARVHRTPPDPPALPPLEDEILLASPADYYGDSYYTFRWSTTSSGLRAHIFRALDDALFRSDWLIRSTRTSLSPNNDAHRRALLFAGLSDSDARTAAQAIAGITDATVADELSDDDWHVLSRLPGNGGILSESDLLGGSSLTASEIEDRKAALLDHDKRLRRSRSALDPAANSQHASLFPDEPRWAPGEPNSAGQRRRRNAADALNALPAGGTYDRSAYDALSPDAQRLLAALPGNDAAFTRLTTSALHPDSPGLQNQRGPDDPADFQVGDPDDPLAAPSLRVYIDRLDGRSRNRYFYRAALVDRGGNESGLGLATPPVEAPNVVPPRRPVLTKALAGHPDESIRGDRMITLRWVRGRDADLDHYRVYRTDLKESTRDVRLMEMLPETVAPGTGRTIEWIDTEVPPQRTFYYRVVAVDSATNVSEPSKALAARAYGIDRPEPPTWQPASVDASTGMASLSWTSPDAQLRSLVQRRDELFGTWSPISPWLPRGEYQFLDEDRATGSEHTYRLRVMDVGGVTNAVHEEFTT